MDRNWALQEVQLAFGDVNSLFFISKMYFSLRKTPEVSERMWSVNLDASIAEEYQTVGGHSGRPSE